MNYSILLLGATISLSLFLRICDVCEANSVESEYFDGNLLKEIADFDEIVYGWLTGDRRYHLKSVFKRTMLSKRFGATSFSGEHSEMVDKLVEEWVSDLDSPKILRSQVNHKLIWDSDSYDEICGANNVRNESHGYDGVIQDVIGPGMVPSGCVYVDKDKTHLSCNDTKLTKIPTLPSSKILILDFKQTQIKDITSHDFGNVTIGHIRFLQNELVKIDTWAFEKVKDLQSLTIINNQIQYLAFELYRGLTELEMLTLDNNRISFEIYQNCELRPVDEIPLVLPKLKYFGLNGNPLKLIPSQMWAGLRGSPVKTLNISSCSLESIDRLALTFLPQLTTLDISDNQMLMPNLATAFEGLNNTKLQKLNLVANNLQTIPKEALAMISLTLTTLDLSYNPIEYLTPLSFSGQMLSLRSLSLENCKLRSIDAGTLELIPNLSTIMLKNNQLVQIPPSISSLNTLTYLSLDNNRNVDNNGREAKFLIPDDTFINLKSLVILSLANLKIENISNRTFVGLSKLSVLILDNTEIKSIEDASFKDLVSLKSLTIKNNPFHPINSLTFYGMDKLEGLYMHNCGLNFPMPNSGVNNETKIVENSTTTPLFPTKANLSTPFEFLPSLRWLELKDNNMDHVYPELFEGAANLTTIDLTGNRIQSWDSPIFITNYTINFTTPAQRQILMSKNKLTKLTDAMVQDITNFQPYVVDMCQNPFICDENACKFRDKLLLPENSTEQKTVFGQLNWTDIENYECIHTSVNQLYKIVNITDELCKSFGDYAQEPDPVALPGTEFQPSLFSTQTILISVGCVAGVIVIVATGYIKRDGLKYACFAAKLNIENLPRKAKTSIVGDEHYDYDLFVSYHNSDRDFVQDKFLPEVEDCSDQNESSTDVEYGKSKRFRVCLHERDFEAGVPIAENIMESVDRSRKVVIMVSKKYLESQWCTYEMNLAYHRLIESRRNSFVLVFLEEIPSGLRTKVLNYLMRSRTYLEWPGNNPSAQEMNRFWSRLTGSLSSPD